MAKKSKNYVILVEKFTSYEVEVEATSEDKALKLAEKKVKADEVDDDPLEVVVDAVEVISEE